MNERIRELAEQARVQDRGYFIYQYGGPTGHQSVEKAIDLEKFAELIVRECIEINKVETTARDLPEYNLGMLEGYRRARENMGIHFGVE